MSSSSSSSLYDATLASLDFRTLLPGLWGLGTDEAESDKETVKGGKVTAGSASASARGQKVGGRSAALVDEFNNFTLDSREAKDGAATAAASAAVVSGTVDPGAGQGMTRVKKRANVKKNKVTGPKKKQAISTSGRHQVGSPVGVAHGVSKNSPLVANPSTSSTAADQAAYPSVFFNDDLSVAPLYPPPLRRTPTRELPRVELEHSSTRSFAMSPASIASSDEVRIEHAHTSALYGSSSDERQVDGEDAERWDVYRSQPDQRHLDWADDEVDDGYYQDDDFTSSSSGGYSADESPYSDEDEEERSSAEGNEVDEPRPFPNPRLKTQQKYIRPPEHDLDYPPPPRGAQPRVETLPAPTQARVAKPNLLTSPVQSPPVQAAVTAYSYAPSLPASTFSHLSPYASPLVSPTLATATHEVAVPSALPSPTSEDATHHDAAAYYAAQEEFYRSSAEDVRGRNPHPRLLWRSVLDRDALQILDAHHERIRGGPLPRLALRGETATTEPSEKTLRECEAHRVHLGASGLEREREHTGVGEDEMKERVRRARRRDPNRRTWSQAGRQWSRQMEQCGL
ncbi:hypothetical protein JCM10908_003810 [Rhodotorula pacifica]|uniref:uncharacterized protein n=1 Tax=Rhodotorula pacifica TaxID=1495444 RepID=UPI00317E5E85